jgi:hypothetical protein
MATTQIDAFGAAMTAAGLVWHQGHVPCLYIDGLGADITAFITFDHPHEDAATCDTGMGLFSGAALEVFSQAPRLVRAERRKQVKHILMVALVEAGIAPGPVCATWQEVIL